MNRLNELASLDLRSLSEVLAAHAPTVPELDRGQWRSVVELITLRLTDESDALSAEAWATCLSALGYALEAAVASGSIDERESLIRRMNLSVVLLHRIPPDSVSDILNPRRLIDLLSQALPISVKEARELAADWRTRDIAQIRLLRAVKNLLSPALSLASVAPGEEIEVRLKEWEGILPLLP